MDVTDLTYDRFFDRDLSWLSFNERVLMEAGRTEVPVFERIRFLSIYSSNLDEFYRVRMPVLLALHKIHNKGNSIDIGNGPVVKQANAVIGAQLQKFGEILRTTLPLLAEHHIEVMFNRKWPDEAEEQVSAYFYSQVLAFLQPVDLFSENFFPENNRLYFLISLRSDHGSRVVVLNIPTENLSRFFSIKLSDREIIVFLDDMIRYNLARIFPDEVAEGCYSFKITRDAEIDLEDEYSGDLAEQIEKQLRKRDFGFATRFLHEPGIPLRLLELMTEKQNLLHAGSVEGGRYHNLKDLADLPLHNPALKYEFWPPLAVPGISLERALLDQLGERDFVVHPPYQSYDAVLRFFNEAAQHPAVAEIYTTLYRVASDSRIVNALISAARNGKKVQVLIELKARFDEENNLKWARELKKAGADILYSIPALKVHAKIALVKFKKHERIQYRGLLATGNLNESTARFYTDHVLMTSNPLMLREIELLFIFLTKHKKPEPGRIPFEQLLVAQFNLQERFIALIDREIAYAQQNLPAAVTIKLNNLEEQTMMAKLYEASRAGVKVQLIVRSICCVVPGIKGMSENITVKRIVDRYLEHGRIFIFYNNGDQEVYMGSADWMNRNLHQRIEVCFPVYDEQIKQQLLQLIDLQLKDNVSAVKLNGNLDNVAIKPGKNPVQSQWKIYQALKTQAEQEQPETEVNE